MIEFEKIPDKKPRYIKRQFPNKQTDIYTEAFVVANKKNISIEKSDDEWKVQLLTPALREAASQYLQKLKDDQLERKAIKERKRSYSRRLMKPKTVARYHPWRKTQQYDLLNPTDNNQGF
ncbi:MAG TPA: hypothetical protein VG917_00175 [Patescibacteria group bacterium]|nr:hypothetical protein [Patescibacteria group bacterium]